MRSKIIFCGLFQYYHLGSQPIWIFLISLPDARQQRRLLRRQRRRRLDHGRVRELQRQVLAVVQRVGGAKGRESFLK